ncbi:hypothetical protein A3C37_02760 [Candidatus Peribacteria bacterium RIFCSPHIGHO2_02_FULL_53_20]|nr:MAG: hypothetical protein A3C37_02760 [Candidatus Peribacteria bacterium RIFCSPHIGHO2_02_FULL_53_20]OGJ72515.1 MAG: hypothetical protein A3G69_05395 [Candidatus Peribacteria bacterium RIFCSPLOWO2_12_FULL_53_10]
MADTSTMDGTGATETFSGRGVEVVAEFIPTPERVSQYLEMDHEQVLAELRSVEGRQRLHQTLVEHEADLRTLYPTFNPESLQSQLDLVGETLSEKERFLRDAESPEKKGMFRRAFESVKGFAKKHPVVMTLLVAALAAAGVAGGFYFTGNWELLLNSIGLEKILGGAKAAEELLPITPPTDILPGGGIFEVPPPASPVPGTGIPT